MDNYPEPNVLPRAADDEATARALSSVLPVVLEQADYEQVYSDCWWRKLKQAPGSPVCSGTRQPGAAWGYCGAGHELADALLGAGRSGHPGLTGFFSLSLEDTAQLTARYPQLAGHTAGVLDVPRYIHEDGADTASRSVVVDWYYKRPDESGHMVLHYCKFCNGWCCTPARTTRHWHSGACTTTGSTPSYSIRCSWKRTARRVLATST